VEGTLVLVLVLGMIVVGMTLMLGAGYLSVEKSRAEQQSRRREAAATMERVLALPAFFESSRPATPIAFVFDDGVVHQVEHHVRLEQALVAQFVHQPSVDNLYREPGTRLQLH
jgi:hypothetical protein